MSMQKSQIAKLLGIAAAFDQRTSGTADDEAWLAAIGDLNFEDAREALIGHYRDSTERVMPAHIRQRVTLIRNDRYSRARIPDPPPDLDQATERAAILAARIAAGDGRDPQAAMNAAIEARHCGELNGGGQ